MRVLIIKLTSMGDLMHALPALTDASKEIENIEFDWEVDENFSEVPSWHPKVKSVITTNHRTWRKNLFSTDLLKELKNLKLKLNYTNYDAVIDMQNNLKSAGVSYLTKNPIHGMDKNSVREFPAHLAYKFKYKIVFSTPRLAEHLQNYHRNLHRGSLSFAHFCTAASPTRPGAEPCRRQPRLIDNTGRLKTR